MNLRRKFIIFLILIFFLLGIINIIPQFYIIFPGFKKIEKEELIKNLKTVEKSIFREITHLDSTCKDWAFWDDTYLYVRTKNKDYEKSNLVKSTFNDLKINFIGIFDRKLNKIWFNIYNFKTKKYIKPKYDFLKSIKKIMKRFNNGVSGFYKIDNYIMLISIKPILKSNHSGPPDGFFVMGKFLSKSFIDKLRKDINIDFAFSVSKKYFKEKYKIFENKNFLIIETIINDIFKKPILILKVINNKKISKFALKVIILEIVFYIILCLIVIIFLSKLINLLIISPLEMIINFLINFKFEKDSFKKIEIKRNDEIGILADSINNFIERIYSQKEKLLNLNNELKKHILKRKNIENKLIETQQVAERLKRMESLALLAGSVAHDLNNILSGIISYPELLLLEDDFPEKYKQIVLKIKNTGERAAKVVEDLLNLTRTIHFVPEVINLNEIVIEYLESPEFERLISNKKNIIIKKNLNKDLCYIEGSKFHLRKVIMNLINNSIEAIDNEGIIKIITDNRLISKKMNKFMEIPAGEYVLLEIVDTGRGIPKKNIDRIFEPFYSTKIMGKSGTGLGLYIVWNTVRAHKGYIDVNSDSKGTTFSIYFPKTKKRERETIKNEKKLIDGKKKKVLVIDDESEQRKIFKEILEKLNFKPILFSSGEEAINYLLENKIDVVILDLILAKGKSGFETLNDIIRINPDQKILIVTGFAGSEIVNKLKELGITNILAKPFSIRELSKMIERILID